MGGLLVVGCASQRDNSLNVTSPRSAVTGHYPNLLVQAGYPAPAVRQKIEEAFHQLFYGNDQQRVYYPAGHNQRGPLGYILDVNNHDVRSEGMSYG
ncbi:MAG: hypothetical protein JXM68_01960, partial [Sedimentisphaerales bacterium]|nr:hypothetical protein [Sedimentisphaerales bacterium]